MFGFMGAIAFQKWLVLGIGILTILVMLVRPREWIYSGTLLHLLPERGQ